jgi:hypothetical protein
MAAFGRMKNSFEAEVHAVITNLVLCSGCERHFRLREPRCPFCGAPADSAQARPRPALLPAGASRSRRHAAALLAGGMVACSSDFTTTAKIGDTDGGGLGAGGSGTGERSAGGGTSTGGRAMGGGTSTGGQVINGTGGTAAGGTGTGGVSGSGSGGIATGGALNTGGIGGGQTCAGATNPTGLLCRTNQECSAAGNYIGCYLSAPPRGCGNPTFQPQQCTADANCGDGGVCQTTTCGGHLCAFCSPSTCSGASKCVSGSCVAKRCDEAGAAPCPTGFVCNPNDPTASSTGCIPVHCTSASDCDPGYDCVTSAPGKGCVHRPCTADGDCACGYCVNTFCEATLGFCYQIIATPYGCVWPDEELV